MDGYQVAGLHIIERLQSILRVAVHLPKGWRPIAADRYEGQLDRKGPTDLQETLEIRRIASKVGMVALPFDDEPAVTAVAVTWCAASPMVRRDEDNLDAIAFIRFPPIEFVDAAKTERGDELSQPRRHHNGHVFRQSTERWLDEVIEVRVGHHDEIEAGEPMDRNPGFDETFGHEHAWHKVRVGQHV